MSRERGQKQAGQRNTVHSPGMSISPTEDTEEMLALPLLLSRSPSSFLLPAPYSKGAPRPDS